MLQNVEYLTLPLNKNVKFWQHFWTENILWVPTFDSMQIIYFTRKYLWNVIKNCERAKKKKKGEMWDSPLYLWMKMPFVIDAAAIL